MTSFGFLAAVAAPILLAGLLQFISFKGGQSIEVQETPKLTKLYLDGSYGPKFGGEMLAEKLEYFNQNAVRVELRSDPNNPDFVANVARSRAIGVTTGQRFLLARWRGERVIAFGASFLDTTTAIFTRPKSGIRYPKDLVDKPLNFRPGSEDAVVFDALLARLGLPRSQIRNIPVENRFGALSRGEVEAVVAPLGDQPVPSVDDASRSNVIRPQDYGIHVPGLVYFASADLVRERPSVVLGALRAVISGWQEVYVDVEKAVPLIIAFDPATLRPDAVRFALDQQRDLVRPSGMRIADFDESRWSSLRDILLFAKLGQQTESLSESVTYEFLREVYRKPLNSDAPRGAAFGN